MQRENLEENVKMDNSKPLIDAPKVESSKETQEAK